MKIRCNGLLITYSSKNEIKKKNNNFFAVDFSQINFNKQPSIPSVHNTC